jgi:hypothetical protein
MSAHNGFVSAHKEYFDLFDRSYRTIWSLRKLICTCVITQKGLLRAHKGSFWKVFKYSIPGFWV